MKTSSKYFLNKNDDENNTINKAGINIKKIKKANKRILKKKIPIID